MKNYNDNLSFPLPERIFFTFGSRLASGSSMLDHLNPFRDGNVSKLGSRICKGLFYFLLGIVTLQGPNIKPGVTSSSIVLLPYFVESLLPIFKTHPQPCRSVKSSTQLLNHLYGIDRCTWEKGPQMPASYLRISLLSKMLTSILFSLSCQHSDAFEEISHFSYGKGVSSVPHSSQ